MIKGIPYDIIFTGQRGIDDDMGVVGGILAESLGIPQLSLITKVEVSEDQKSVKVHRPVEGQTSFMDEPNFTVAMGKFHESLEKARVIAQDE